MNSYKYLTNGRHIRIIFEYAYDYPQFLIDATFSIDNLDAVATSSTPVPWSAKLSYDNIPVEFLRTVHDGP